MQFSLKDIASEELRLVEDATVKYGDHWAVLQEATEMLWQFPTEMRPEYGAVSPYLAIVRKYSLLAALSAIRQHYAQSVWCLRQVHEAGVVGTHALAQPTSTVEQLQQFSHDPEQAFKRACEWLEVHHPEQNTQVQQIKTRLHRWSHASFASGCLNARIENRSVRIEVFDRENIRIGRTLLWLNAHTIMRFMTLWGAIANPKGGILLERQFPRMAGRILDTLAQHAEILKREYPPRSSRVSAR